MQATERIEKVDISYHKDSDSLYIFFKEVPTYESEEIAENTVIHFDFEGNVTGIEFYGEASKKVDLSTLKQMGIA